jgi:16S rRNA (guanine966-N2)-methyltransferase
LKLRIIAGSARGRRFDAPEGRNTRPTLDRVKEAMFGMIQFDIENTQVLDLFSGSGSLGLEALSRGGAHCVFCDSDKKSIQVIKHNVEILGFGGRSEVLFGDAFALLPLLSAEKRRFSLVLLDPPYESDFYSRAVNELARLNLLEDGCIILAEHAFKRPPQFNCPNISCGKTHKYGDAAVTKIIYSEQREEQS